MWVLEGHPTGAVILGTGREFLQPRKLLLQSAATKPIVVRLQLCKCGLQLRYLNASWAAGEFLQHCLVDKDVLLLEGGTQREGERKEKRSTETLAHNSQVKEAQ